MIDRAAEVVAERIDEPLQDSAAFRASERRNVLQDDDGRQVMPNVLKGVEHKASSPSIVVLALFVAQIGKRLAWEARNHSIHLPARRRIAIRDGAAQDDVSVVRFEVLNRPLVDLIRPVWSEYSQVSQRVTRHIDASEIAEQANPRATVVDRMTGTRETKRPR